MWILPKNIRTSLSVPVMEELTSDLSLQGSLLSSLFMWRSKPSQPTTWRRRLKANAWVRELYGLILKPSPSESFEEDLILCLADFRASRSPKLEKEKATKIPDTYSPTSLKESGNVSQLLLSLKTSKESSAQSSKEIIGETQPERPFCSMSLESWKEWVIEQRQSRRARQKSVLLTSETGGSLSAWPTAAAARDWKGCGNAVVRKDGQHRLDTLEAVVMYGQPAPDKSNSDGSQDARLEAWGTPRVTTNGGCPSPQCTGKGSRLEDQAAAESWGTPMAPSGGNNDFVRSVETDCGIRKGNKKTTSAKLNSRWVETLQGLPVGWVMPSCKHPVTIVLTNFGSLETDASLHQLHGQSGRDSVSCVKEHNPAPMPSEEGCGRCWPTPAVFDTTGGPYRTEVRSGAFRSKHDNKPNSPWYGAKLRDAVSVESRATPNTMDRLDQRSEEAMKRQATTTRKGRTKPSNLREQVDPDMCKTYTEAASENKKPQNPLT